MCAAVRARAQSHNKLIVLLFIFFFSSQQMNQLCKVCGEPAAGFHFGAFTCEGCKVTIS